MTTYSRKSLLALLTALTMLGLAASTHASGPTARLLPPNRFPLPKFGFDSYNIRGVGDRVTHVRWGGLASRMGLEPGDTILSLNGHPLSYHGAWNNALREAVHEGGFVRLRIRNIRTGRIAFRQIHVDGGRGPVTPKSRVAAYPNDPSRDLHDDHDHRHDGHGHSHGRVTEKSKVVPIFDGRVHDKKFDRKHDRSFDGSKDFNKAVRNLTKLFDDND